MDWRVKAALCRGLSLRGGRLLHRFAQQRLTRSLSPQTNLKDYRDHRDALLKHAGTLDGALYEFGAGWHLSSQIAMWCYGVPRQVALDIERLAHLEMVQAAIRAFSRIDDPYFVRTPSPTAQLEELGVEYRAPADPGASALPENSIDFVISTHTLEHIPPEDIRRIMRECRRICRPGSVLSMTIDYSDHYSHADPTISRVNFLRFSDREWKKYQSRTLYQNRLRHSDYRRIFEESGLRVTEESRMVLEEELRAVRQMPLADRFAGYDLEDLAARHGHYLLRPA
jgi:SAM-dependent methyltransferase